ncbi:MAG: 50S ribosomal protein L22 [Candidatus Kerfeldbacteria bacterium]|nr:50S ribosomal protein L22 [Candidatus Kerfeldbacteria bacterium]
MDVVAKLRFLRLAPRKVRLVLDLIRGQAVTDAEVQLQHLPKAASRPLLKLLKSAEANAEHNFKLDPKTLYVKQAFADEGPKLKRFQPRAMGRATPVMKRLSHVTVVLAPRIGATPSPKKPAESAPAKWSRKNVKGQPAEPSVSGSKSTATPTSVKRSSERLSHPGEKAKV